MPWDKPNWLDGFHSLSFLVDFELWTWYYLKQTDNAEIQIIM